MCFSLYQYHYYDYINHKSSRWILSVSFLFFKIVLGILAFWILLGFWQKLYQNLERIDTFNISCLPIYEHGISLHLFILSLSSFISFVQISACKLWTCFVRITVKYFILSIYKWYCILNFSVYVFTATL